MASTIPKTATERKRAERERRRRLGLVRVEGWVHPDDAASVRQYIARLNRRRAP